MFFTFAGNEERLPPDVDENTISSFLAILISVVSLNYGNNLAIKALTILFTFLKNGYFLLSLYLVDQQVFSRFIPTIEIMKKMNIHKYLMSKASLNLYNSFSAEGEEAEELVLDFICFLLRYYRDVDYLEISDDMRVISKIRRAEIHRSINSLALHDLCLAWADIENLAINQESISSVFYQHQNTTSNAFSEIFEHIEEIRKKGDSRHESTTDDIINIKVKFYSTSSSKLFRKSLVK